MKTKLRLMRLLFGLGGLLVVAYPSIALAHEETGGDELSVANWMLIAAMVTVVLGIFMALWAYRSGQFSNVEQSKFTMLDTAEDFDAIMAEADAREAAARAAAAEKEAGAGKAEAGDVRAPVAPSPVVAKGELPAAKAGRADTVVHV